METLGQGAQTALVVALHTCFWVPVGHGSTSEHCWHVVEPVVEVYVWYSHLKQSFMPTIGLYFPAAQIVHMWSLL
jgi:hypothetical protein